MKIIKTIALSFFISTLTVISPLSIHAEETKTFTIHYIMKSNGEVIQNTRETEAFTFTTGTESVMPALEEAVSNWDGDNTISIDVPAAEAFGIYREDAIVEIPLEAFGETEIKEGGVYEFPGTMGSPFMGIVQKIEDNIARVDFNHPLAGKDISMEIEVLAVS